MKRSARMIAIVMVSVVPMLAALLSLWLFLPEPVQAATCDVPSGIHPTIQSAVDDAGCDTINLVAPLYTENITVTRSVTIQGQGMENTTVDGGGIDRVFTIQPGLTVTLTNMGIIHGTTGGIGGSGGGILNMDSSLMLSATAVMSNTSFGLFGGNGGGIANVGSSGIAALVIQNSEIQVNSAESCGGVVNLSGVMTIDNSTINGNTTTSDNGGGICNSGAGILTVTNSLISNNSTMGCGGGILSDGYVTVLHNSVISGNQAWDGGGVCNFFTSIVTINQSTLANNSAVVYGQGGAIYNVATIVVENSTVSGNFAEAHGGGLFMNSSDAVTVITNSTWSNNSALAGGSLFRASGSLSFANTIFANSPNGGECSADEIAININNLVEDGSCNPALSGDPLLGPLQDNGGSTLTHALLAGSLAIDAGDNAACLAADQRGMTRPQDGDDDGTAVCDIGAYELTTNQPVSGLMATNDGPTALGQTTVLTATVAAGSNVSYTWSFGDGEVGSGAVVSHIYEAVGEYTAVVTATNPINTVAITTTVTIVESKFAIYLPYVLSN